MANFYGSLIGFGAGGAAKFTTATGGSSANVGDYTVHTFTGSGTFEVTSLGDDETVDWLLIAGGAAGFRFDPSSGGGGGGGGSDGNGSNNAVGGAGGRGEVRIWAW